MHIQPDRKKAIEFAISQAGLADIVIIAGKGHETYQEVKGKKYPFNEQSIVNACLEEHREKFCKWL